MRKKGLINTVKEIRGNVLDMDGIICHQVNFHGVMGAGIAKAIRTKLLTPEQFKTYREFCDTQGEAALGQVLVMQAGRSTRLQFVANLFCQNGWDASGWRGFLAAANPRTVTNYGMMRKCFQLVRETASRIHQPVAIPGYIGCGIAGGDWEIVRGIIHDVFGGSEVEATIVYWEKERQQ